MSDGSGPAINNLSALDGKAISLVNPASGLANDYLNLFNEVLMIIEQLPVMPELLDDLMAWKPVTYQEYFSRSVLPGSRSALDDYNRLAPVFRQRFEALVGDLDRQATGAVVSIRRHIRTKGTDDAPALAAICEKAVTALRETLERAVALVNHGSADSAESAQARADRLLAVRIKALSDMREFWTKPRFPGGG